VSKFDVAQIISIISVQHANNDCISVYCRHVCSRNLWYRQRRHCWFV